MSIPNMEDTSYIKSLIKSMEESSSRIKEESVPEIT